MWPSDSDIDEAVDIFTFDEPWTGIQGAWVAVETGEMTFIEFWQIQLP